ncbi:MAG: DUF3329 domain-containing protein [Pseudaminobacter sp.]
MTKDNEHPFFRPLWRRIAVVAVCIAWAGVEIAAGERIWALVASAAACYAVWQLLLRYSPPADTGGKR